MNAAALRDLLLRSAPLLVLTAMIVAITVLAFT